MSGPLKHLLVASGVALLCAPVAFAATLLSTPLWRWVEKTSGVEAVGHSGPATWCYAAVYGGLLAALLLGYLRLASRTGAAGGGRDTQLGRPGRDE